MQNNILATLVWLRTSQESKSQQKYKREMNQEGQANKNRKTWAILRHFVLPKTKTQKMTRWHWDFDNHGSPNSK